MTRSLRALTPSEPLARGRRHKSPHTHTPRRLSIKSPDLIYIATRARALDIDICQSRSLMFTFHLSPTHPPTEIEKNHPAIRKSPHPDIDTLANRCGEGHLREGALAWAVGGREEGKGEEKYLSRVYSRHNLYTLGDESVDAQLDAADLDDLADELVATASARAGTRGAAVQVAERRPQVIRHLA